MVNRTKVPEGHIPPVGLVYRGQKRTDWDAHRERVRAANRARYRATVLLIEAHPEEYDRLYAYIGAQQDPPVQPKPRGTRTEMMLAELADLQAQLVELQEGGDG